MGLKQIFLRKNQQPKTPEVLFQEWFNSYWQPLVAFCQHHCHDEAIAMDIVQDIFCSLWNRQDSLGEIVEIEHYLYRAARIRISDYYRQLSRRKSQDTLLTTAIAEDSNTTEETVYLRDLAFFVNTVVDGMPTRCREVYLLSRSSGLTIPEIAVSLSISEKTVEAHLTKALKVLRHQLRPIF